MRWRPQLATRSKGSLTLRPQWAQGAALTTMLTLGSSPR